MKKILLLFLLCFVQFAEAQTLDQLFSDFMTAYGADDIASMDKAADNIIKLEPDNYAGYAFKGYASLLQKDTNTAEQFINTARMINPIDQASYGIAAYVAFAKGDTAKADELLSYSFQLKTNDTYLQATLDDINQVARLTGADMSGLIAKAKTLDTITTGAPAAMQQFFGCVQGWHQGADCANESSVRNFFESQQPVNELAVATLDYYKGFYHYNTQAYELAESSFKKFVNNSAITNDVGRVYAAAQAYHYLTFIDPFDANAMYLNTEKGLAEIKKLKATTLLECQLLHRKTEAQATLGKSQEQLATAQTLLQKATAISYPLMQIQAENTLGGYYVMSALASDRQKANGYLSKAYSAAQKLNNPALLNNVAGNYAISLWQQGNKDQAVNVATKSYEYSVENKNYDAAQLMTNNLGFMSFIQEDYKSASQLFRKSVNITEQYRKNLPAARQLALMNEHTSAYGGLIMSLQKTNNVAELFEVQDLNRSRLLRDKLDKNAKAKSLTEAQNMLKEDEVLLYYSEAAPGEMIVTVVTSNEATIGYSYPIDDWLKLKQTFINRLDKKPTSINGYLLKMNQELVDGNIIHYQDEKQAFKKEDYDKVMSITRELLNTTKPDLKPVQDQFLKAWHQHLIAPISAKLQGKTKLIISGEGSLNYLPFEALLSSENRYLIQDFDVRYIPSVTAWASLLDRNYNASRKSLLAMGGATYQDPNKKGGAVRTINSLFEIQDNISEKINKDVKDLSQELNALGFGGANYLPGTLKEVQNLKKIVPDATVLIDGEMKESDLKSLDASKQLANYKWIHIATHGFAIDHIPALSGVMMTQPDDGDGAEDTFLLTHEIAALHLKADLAVLSACETALGKVYGGEGINGLNSALLVAGANNTLLSLWPVNDQGTMVMMTVMYDYLHNKKLPVNEAVNKTKRDILNGVYGEQFKSPSIWAPFILNGK